MITTKTKKKEEGTMLSITYDPIISNRHEIHRTYDNFIKDVLAFG